MFLEFRIGLPVRPPKMTIVHNPERDWLLELNPESHFDNWWPFE